MAATITIGNHVFERVAEFRYLRSTITHSNDISYEIRQALIATNRAYFALAKLCSCILLCALKITIFKSLIWPASETWPLTKKRY